MSELALEYVIDKASNGLVHIRPQKAYESNEVLLSRLEVSGGTIFAYVDDPNLAISVEITDPELASWWLEQLFGEELFEATFELLRNDLEIQTAVAVQQPSKLYEWSQRLLLANWLWRYWPAVSDAELPKVNEWLFSAELGLLAWQSEELFGDVELARRFLDNSEVVGRLKLVLEQIIGDESANPKTDSNLSTLLASARAAVDVLWTDTEGYEELANAFEKYSELRRAQDLLENDIQFANLVNALNSEQPAGSSAVEQREPALVAAADGSTGSVMMVGDVITEPSEVHPRSIDMTENAARWRVLRTGTGLQLEVSVSTEARATLFEAGDLILAQVFLSGERIAEIPLEFGKNKSALSGSMILPEDSDPNSIQIQLSSDLYGSNLDAVLDAADTRSRQAQRLEFLKKRRASILSDPRGLAGPSRPLLFELEVDNRSVLA
ncbi:MAG: hypothetical protein KF772_04815 [Cryobacterium sp.]|nr:hypothetical protein [Cryobacterium sp.]